MYLYIYMEENVNYIFQDRHCQGTLEHGTKVLMFSNI